MAGRKAPRPLPRPVRWLAMFLALVFVVSLGMVVNHQVVDGCSFNIPLARP